MSSVLTEARSLDFRTGSDFPLEYAPSVESVDHAGLKPRYDLFIGGRFVKASRARPIINPATEERLCTVSEAGPKEIQAAVDAARQGYQKYWSRLKPLERGKYLFRIARLIQERARALAVVESLNGGKPVRESKTVDIPLAAAHFFYYGGWADKISYALRGRSHAPLGVAAQIIPWNFPLLMAAWKVAPALATGNCVVLKPAETTPLTALMLAELMQEADLPPGVVNIVTGGPEAGKALLGARGVNKIAFTGSTEVGKSIYAHALRQQCPVSLELGGKAAHLIFEDAALDQAVEGVINGIFFNQGHVCCAGSRLLVQESVSTLVIRKLKDRLATLRVGNPLDKNTDLGAINSKEQLNRIQHYLALGSSEGATLFQPAVQLPAKGYWCAPSVFIEVSQSSRIVQEEIFGPVLTVQTFRTAEEGIEKANNTPYGLSGGVWTDKGSKIFKVSSQLRAGVLWANTYNRFDPSSPFGGYKESGFGREGGLQGLLPYLNVGALV
jgi:aldehyde dehydrogenase (NAD+)